MTDSLNKEPWWLDDEEVVWLSWDPLPEELPEESEESEEPEIEQPWPNHKPGKPVPDGYPGGVPT